MNGITIEERWDTRGSCRCAGEMDNWYTDPNPFRRLEMPMEAQNASLSLSVALGGIGWAGAYALAGALAGAALMLLFSVVLPRIVNRMTPNIDEEKEIARGNRAVAEYFGRVVSAGIIGMSIIVAAAVLGGLLAALHG
jgi:hypothetical protein